MSNLQIANLMLRDDNFPLLTETIINQEIIEKNGNFISINRLAQLKVALDALQPVPPNANTVWFDNTILLDASSGITNTMNNSSTIINNTNTQRQSILDDTALVFTDVANTTTATLNSNSLTTQNTIGQYSSVSLGSFSVIDTPNGVSSTLSANNLVITDTLSNKNATLNNSQGLAFDDNNQKGSFLRADLFSMFNLDPLLGDVVGLSADALGGYKIDSQTTSNITTLNSGSLTFSNPTASSSSSLTFLPFTGDFILDANTNRLLLNANDNEFYLGQYSSNTAPCIISTGNSGMTLNMNSRGGTASIGDCDNAFNSTKITIEDGGYKVNTNAVMMTAYNNAYILPICYTKKMTNSISYINVNNTWQNVYQDNINAFPSEFFNPNNTFWDYKIEFSINMRNVSNPGDKMLALYFEILDGNSTVYTSFLYNQNTPWTRHPNGSTYNATASDMLTFTWTDYISFNNSVVPVLTFSLWWYGEQDNSPAFEALLSLTRTNLV